MSKLSKEELLRELREVFDYYLKDLRDYPSEIIVKQAYQQIKEMIQKPRITEGWIEEKAFEVYDLVHKGEILLVKKFIRSLVKEIQGVA